MSDKLRNLLIRVALVGMLACYYVGGLIADSPNSHESVLAPRDDLRADAERRRSVGKNDPLIRFIEEELARHDDDPILRESSVEHALELGSTAVALRSSLRELREGIYASRFEICRSELASHSATLALLSDYCGRDDTCQRSDADKWRPVCYSLRDAALELNVACHSGSQTAAVAALNRTEQAFDQWLALAES